MTPSEFATNKLTADSKEVRACIKYITKKFDRKVLEVAMWMMLCASIKKRNRDFETEMKEVRENIEYGIKNYFNEAETPEGAGA